MRQKKAAPFPEKANRQDKEEIRELHNNLRWLEFGIPVWEYYARYYGKGTQASVEQFQERNGLEKSGIADEQTKEALVLKAARGRRQYRLSTLPVFKDQASPEADKAVYLALYGEVCNSWRLLTDVRFKLLGFVPTASIVLLISLLSQGAPDEGLSKTSRVAICITGFLVTAGLYIYDRRNSELYDDLVSRGRRIESELGIDTGQFLGRKQPSISSVQHGTAIKLIYGSALFAWLFAVYATWSGLL